MNPYRAVFTRPRVLAEQAAGYAVTGAVLYWWLGLEESSTPMLALSAITVLAIAAALWWLVRRARNAYQGGATAGARATAAVGLALAIAIAWGLVWWVPPIGPFTVQAVSAAVRLTLAYMVILSAWLALLSALSSARTEPAPPSSPATPL